MSPLLAFDNTGPLATVLQIFDNAKNTQGKFASFPTLTSIRYRIFLVQSKIEIFHHFFSDEVLKKV
jgi:hypothetical protein